MERDFDIEKAIGAHVHWMSWLRQSVLAIFGSIGTNDHFDIAKIRSGEGCELGKWLEGAQRIVPDRQNHSYHKVQRLHTEFHEASARVIELALSGNIMQAYTLLYGDFLTISGRLVLALRAWQTELLTQIWRQQNADDQ